MIVGSYRDLVLPFDEMPKIFQQPDIQPSKKTSRDFFIPETNGLNDWTANYANTTGIVFVGVIGFQINGTIGVDINMSMTYGGLPMEKVFAKSPTFGTTGIFVALFMISDPGVIGSNPLHITTTGTDAGFAAVKISEAINLDVGWLADQHAYSTNSDGAYGWTGLSTGNRTVSDIPDGVTVLSFGGCNNFNAYPMNYTYRVNDDVGKTGPNEFFSREKGPTNELSYSFGRMNFASDVTKYNIFFRCGGGATAPAIAAATVLIRGTFKD